MAYNINTKNQLNTAFDNLETKLNGVTTNLQYLDLFKLIRSLDGTIDTNDVQLAFNALNVNEAFVVNSTSNPTWYNKIILKGQIIVKGALGPIFIDGPQVQSWYPNFNNTTTLTWQTSPTSLDLSQNIKGDTGTAVFAYTQVNAGTVDWNISIPGIVGYGDGDFVVSFFDENNFEVFIDKGYTFASGTFSMTGIPGFIKKVVIH